MKSLLPSRIKSHLEKRKLKQEILEMKKRIELLFRKRECARNGFRYEDAQLISDEMKVLNSEISEKISKLVRL